MQSYNVFQFAAFVCDLVPRPQIVYKRYASLYFVAAIGKDDNELLTLEIIHHYVEGERSRSTS
jgi:hypothetical protein